MIRRLLESVKCGGPCNISPMDSPVLESPREHSLANQTRPSGPADRLRERLTTGTGRLAVIASTALVWLMDLLLAQRLERDPLLEPGLRDLVIGAERLGTVLFVIVSVGMVVALLRGRSRSLVRWGLAYMLFALLQVVANVAGMIFTAGHYKGAGLANLWDVAAVYTECVLVFMFIYVFLDVNTPGGAFVWPSREGEAPRTPHVIDYLFISLNVNSAYGPTSVDLVSRPAKLLMALQVLVAFLILTVLIARAVSSIS